jgi:uncharacterized membrane protein
MDYQQFTEQLLESPLKRFASIVAWLTPASELVLALLLLFPKTRKTGLYGSFLLMMAFTCYIIYLLKYVPDIPCSCGGILENMTWTQHLIFNIIFTLLALIGLLMLHPRPVVNNRRWRTRIVYGSMGTVILVLIAGAISVSAIGIRHINPPRPGDPIPKFNLQLMDSTSYMNTADIPGGQPVVVSYFRPDCSHCQLELIELTARPDSVKNIHFYFITSSSFKKTRSLYQAMHLEKFSFITMAIDTGNIFAQYFKPRVTPFQVLYNQNKQLTTLLPGEVPIRELVAASRR